MRDVWQLEKKTHEEFKHMKNRSLADRLLQMFPEEYKQALIAQQLTLTANPKMTFFKDLNGYTIRKVL